jgi:predicted esterase
LGLGVACHAGSGARALEANPQPVEPDEELAAGAEASEPEQAASAQPVIEELAVEGALPLLVWAPSGTATRPLIISAHGAGCMPEDHCSYLWELSQGQAIVACLRGDPLYRKYPERGFFYRDHFALGRELEAAAAALRQRFDGQLDSSWTYVGYSQGATMGALALPESALGFEQILLIEGGGEGMPRASAERLKERGTERVLFVCGTKSCAEKGRKTASTLRAAGLDVRVEEAPGAGHTYLGAVEERVAAQVGWLLR